MDKKLRKVMIVIEETGQDDGKHFNVYMAGDKERLGVISEKEMSPAEFWGLSFFRLCIHTMQEVGAVKDIKTTDGKH